MAVNWSKNQAQKGYGTISVSVGEGHMKHTISGKVPEYTPESAYKWVHQKQTADNTEQRVFRSTADYIGGTGVATTDLVQWFCIKNLGTASTVGLVFEWSNASSAGVWDEQDAFIIGPGEMVALKLAGDGGAQAQHFNIRSCTLNSNGRVTAQGSATCEYEAMGIIKDVS